MLLNSIILAAALQASPIQPLLDNALQVSSDAGSYVTYFHEDGTYTTNVGISGTWHVEDGELCVVRATGEAGCAPIESGLALGSSWTAPNAATGAMVTYTIIARD
ncbi:hypothetical protein AWH62_04245 [Maricaulis sp. W15]|uniref:hypothetical protein n=1 Tax=Maricaulis sp. W15 TaxID=1772333 RepID=UPI000948B62D|nr:hypothetical protein [Maricaulis sp. W15]OLF77889.1 hypothetical protein AWH62_04245 [Maricaulis sp. W15]